MVSTDDLVLQVHAQYASCGFKPSNTYQYTVLAAFVLELCSDNSNNINDGRLKIHVASMATGSKCLPTSRFSAQGDSLHDSHAEVLARRGFVKWLYEELRRSQHMASGSEWLAVDKDGKWHLREGIKLHLYISTIPCKIKHE